MIIVAFLTAMGISALIGLRESSKVNRTATDFASQAKTDISNARNNVYTPTELNLLTSGAERSCSLITTHDFVPDAIGYRFENNTFKTIKCLSYRISTTADYCCTEYDSGNSLINLKDEKINYGASCTGVLFEYSTGDVVTTTSDQISLVSVDNTTNCDVTVRNTQIGFNKVITFDVDANAVNIQQ